MFPCSQAFVFFYENVSLALSKLSEPWLLASCQGVAVGYCLFVSRLISEENFDMILLSQIL